MAASSETEAAETQPRQQTGAIPLRPTIPTTSRAPSNVAVLTAVLRTGIRLLNVRFYTLLAVLAAAALFGYAMFQPDRERTVVAAAFAILVLAPVLWLHARTGFSQDDRG